MIHQQTGTFTISSPRLAVELATPGGPVQRGARFDLTGHAVQVTLDGRHTFSAPEAFDEGRGSGGLGLCNEFKDPSDTMYAEAAPGGKFPKFGVGLVTRPDAGAYSFMKDYEKDLFPFEVEAGESQAMFTVKPAGCMGYAAELVKTLSVQSNALRIGYRFTNAGTRRLELTEYNHNFVRVDGHAIGPGYRMRFPYPVNLDRELPVLHAQGSDLVWTAVPDGAFFCLPGGFPSTPGHSWELVHEPSGAGMRETDDFPVEHLALWGMSHVVSLEAFIGFALEPGETREWARTYEFFGD